TADVVAAAGVTAVGRATSATVTALARAAVTAVRAHAIDSNRDDGATGRLKGHGTAAGRRPTDRLGNHGTTGAGATNGFATISGVTTDGRAGACIAASGFATLRVTTEGVTRGVAAIAADGLATEAPAADAESAVSIRV